MVAAHTVTLAREVTLPAGTHAAAAFCGSPGLWLPEDARASGFETWRVRLSAGPLHRDVLLRMGEPWGTGNGFSRRLHWRDAGPPVTGAGPSSHLPTFDGAILLDAESPDTLVISGTYGPPHGAVGALLDAAVLHRVAEASVTGLLEQIAQGLVDRVLAER